MLMFCASLLLAQDIDVHPETPYYNNTLTATRDTIDITFDRVDAILKKAIQSYTFTAYTTTGIDTVKIYTLSLDATIWVYKSTIIVTTTPIETDIDDPQPYTIRLITNDSTANTVFVVAAKNVVSPLSMNEKLDSIKIYLSSLVALSASNLGRAFHDTLTTRIDTLSRKIAGDTTNNLNYIFVGSKAWQGDITVNDTVEVSSDATFPAGKVTIVYPNSQPGLPLFRRLLFYHPNMYIRRYVTTGGTGTVTIDFRIWAY